MCELNKESLLFHRWLKTQGFPNGCTWGKSMMMKFAKYYHENIESIKL